MRCSQGLAAAIFFALSVPCWAEDRLRPGIWTNTEDVAFAAEEGRPTPDPVQIELASDGRWRRVDPFGAALGEWRDGAVPELARQEGGSGWQIGGSEIRHAQAFSCWVSARKFAPKPDGSADWTFTSNRPTFDQGGRIMIPGEGLAPDLSIRLRNVTWAKGSRNKPSLVLYIHKDDPERAESYSWAAPDAALIGINLRWVQASCSRVDQP